MIREFQKTIFSLLLLLWAGVASAQTLKGKVLDDQQEPLLGVTIVVKDSPSRGLQPMRKESLPSESLPKKLLSFPI